MTKKTRLKSKAQVFVCQSKEEAADCIKRIGDAERHLTRVQTELNDIIADETAKRTDVIDDLKKTIDTLTDGVQMWCEANRQDLCSKGSKTANLVTGEVSWRQRPPSVSVRGKDKIIDTLKQLKLARFLRQKDEINKEAILAEPNAVAHIKGLKLVTGVEDFVITPFEVDIQQ